MMGFLLILSSDRAGRIGILSDWRPPMVEEGVFVRLAGADRSIVKELPSPGGAIKSIAR